MWTMIGEVFPLSVRGVGVGFSSLINWGANLLVSLMFPVLLEHFSMPIIFGAFAVMCVLGSGTVNVLITAWAVRVMETRGRKEWLLIGGFGMAVSLIALSILTSLSVTGIMSYVTIVAMAFYLIFF
ncbi:MFS transporter [Weissella confusa]|uniref:MFS transporter n=1 Tax=Weissella confusa TaxID=1583 RepID=A0A923NIC8_WEICO|nr:MFS transporter [Weissella confusa]